MCWLPMISRAGHAPGVQRQRAILPVLCPVSSCIHAMQRTKAAAEDEQPPGPEGAPVMVARGGLHRCGGRQRLPPGAVCVKAPDICKATIHLQLGKGRAELWSGSIGRSCSRLVGSYARPTSTTSLQFCPPRCGRREQSFSGPLGCSTSPPRAPSVAAVPGLHDEDAATGQRLCGWVACHLVQG